MLFSHRGHSAAFQNTIMAFPPQAKPLIEVGLESRILLPDDLKYIACTDSYFDNASKFQPVYILQPWTESEVAAAIKALADAGQAFAVRSGGCTVRPGSNNIEGGVTIDLSLLNSIEYNPDNTAHVGPGATWYDPPPPPGEIVSIRDRVETPGQFHPSLRTECDIHGLTKLLGMQFTTS